ncbi:tetratricopeptide repeat protein [Streptomyces canus]|uniref:tetratricopeptide repeat protein n=1 Tax=Streptomyces canus TaxID=58343 RepID=UPI0030E2339D
MDTQQDLAATGALDTATDVTELKRRLEEARVRRGFSKNQLKTRAGLGRTTVSRALSVSAPAPTADTVGKLAAALGLDVEPLLGLLPALATRIRSEPRLDPLPGSARPDEGALTHPARPIRDWTARRLGVHPAILGRPMQQLDIEFILPTYVPRPHDHQLRELLATAVTGAEPLMVLVRGESCTGKTRSAYEAIRYVAPADWQLFFPSDANSLLETLRADAVPPRTVLWLNETQDYLTGEAGEAAAAALLRRLDGHGPLIVVATLWPEYDKALRAKPTGAGVDDPHRNARALLAQTTRIMVPDTFADSLETLHAAAGNDPSLAAVAELGTTDVTQTLAAGPDLVEHYEHPTGPDGPYGAAVISAAMDAHRLGVTTPLPVKFLEAAAPGYLKEMERADASDGWFTGALAYAQTRIKRVTSPLQNVPRPSDMGCLPGVVGLADYLQQHGRHTRRFLFPPDHFWQAACRYATTDDDRSALALAAQDRGRYGHARALYESMAQPNAYALAITADEAGDEQEFERRLGQVGNHQIATSIRADHALETGDEATAFALLSELEELGWPDAFVHLGRIHERAGRREEALRCYQRAAELNDPDGMQELARLYFEDGKREPAQVLYERSAEIGDIYAYSRLGHQYLTAGDTAEAERYFRKAIAAGLIECYRDLIEVKLPTGDAKALGELLAEAAEAGEISYPMWKAERDGDHDTADDLALDASAWGYVAPLRHFCGSA